MLLYQADPCEQTFQNALDQTGKDAFFQDDQALHIILFKILGRIEKILNYHFCHFRTLPVG